MGFEAKTQTDTVTTTTTATVPCTETDLMMDTNTATTTVTIAPTVQCSQVDLHPLATAVTMNQTPGNAMVDQGSKSSGSQTVWMVVAVFFLMMAIYPRLYCAQRIESRDLVQGAWFSTTYRDVHVRN